MKATYFLRLWVCHTGKILGAYYRLGYGSNPLSHFSNIGFNPSYSLWFSFPSSLKTFKYLFPPIVHIILSVFIQHGCAPIHYVFTVYEPSPLPLMTAMHQAKTDLNITDNVRITSKNLQINQNKGKEVAVKPPWKRIVFAQTELTWIWGYWF